MTAPSPAFRRLALITLGTTFALIVLGGIVRLSHSGLGCGPAGSGLHGWPLCRGDIIPGLDPNTLIEYAHRATASIVGLLLIALAVLAVRRLRAYRGIVRATLAGVVLVIAQGLLGAVVVEENLAEELVAAHLGLAMLLLALVLYIWRAAKPGVAGAEPPASTRGLRLLSVAAPAAILMTIVAGGYVAGTEKYGRTDREPGAGAHYACGNDFPGCNGGFLPFGQTRLADIQLTHRAFMYLAAILVIWLTVQAVRRRPSAAVARSAHAAGGLLVLQILLGALNVWIPEQYEILILAHLTVGTLLWGSLALLALQLSRVPAPEPAGRAAGAPPPRQPVAA